MVVGQRNIRPNLSGQGVPSLVGGGWTQYEKVMMKMSQQRPLAWAQILALPLTSGELLHCSVLESPHL